MNRLLFGVGVAGCVLAALSTASIADTPAKVLTKTSASMTKTLSVIVERDIPAAPKKVWHALTEPKLIAQWLMKNDFKPAVGHRFTLTASWGAVHCRVLTVVPQKKLSYSWVAYGLHSLVTWTLTPTHAGTHLRMEQSGFPPDEPQYYNGAKGGWPGFMAGLQKVVAQKN